MLDALSSAGLIWKNPTTDLWKAGGDGAVDVEKLIDDSTSQIPKQTLAGYLRGFTKLANDLLPMLGVHTLDPSAAGIVRRYAIEAKSAADAAQVALNGIAAKAVIVLTSGHEEAQQFEQALLGKPRANIFYWISFAEPRNLDELVRRYLGITALLSQSHNDATKTRLNAKFEAVRNELKASFGRLYGREGLREKTTKVVQQGEHTPIEVTSWHGFSTRLQQIVDATYTGEVAVRAPQRDLNVLGGDSSPDSKTISEIVEKILQFRAGAEDDLLGEPETGQSACIIDGVLGANGLFIRRASGWDFKTVDELEGNIKKVISEIRSLLSRRRDRAYQLYELRRVFENAPYGIPAGALPLLIAFAIREDLERLSWTQGGSTTKNICEGMVNERVGVRCTEFTGHQVNVLEVLRYALDYVNDDKFSWSTTKQEAARQAVEQLRDFLKIVPEPVLKSSKLDKRFRDLADSFRGVAVPLHEIVDRLVLNVDPHRELGAGEPPYEAKKKASETLKEILCSYRQVEDERRFDLVKRIQSVVESLSGDTQRDQILSELSGMNAEGKSIAESLSRVPLSDSVCITLIERLSGARLNDVSDTNAGMAIGKLEATIATARTIIARLAAAPPTAIPDASGNGAGDDVLGAKDGVSAANSGPFWPSIPHFNNHTSHSSIAKTSENAEFPTITDRSCDWRITLKNTLNHLSERKDIEKDEMVSILQSFITELEAKV
ncbi:hypothetical protein [Noviherbaspirillum soli]|uniref:hypothetical protein n=1 Tax=Noviherbaspirillum soli TaxID=1064518 RepID=UPI00188CDD18|nr:hypothetical protein [Noviherbaspirillum soli]